MRRKRTTGGEEGKKEVEMEGWRRSEGLRVEADGGDERAEESLGLGVAAGPQQGPPVLGAGHHLALQAAVTQVVGQPHLRVAHVLAHLHLVGDGHAAGGLAHVESLQGPHSGGGGQEGQAQAEGHGGVFNDGGEKSREAERTEAGCEWICVCPPLPLYTHQREWGVVRVGEWVGCRGAVGPISLLSN